MSIAESSGEFISGLQNIERAIISGVRTAGLTITAHNFKWHRGQQLVPPPEAVMLEIKLQGRSTNATVSREQAEDSSFRVDRTDVIALVDALVKDLTAG